MNPSLEERGHAIRKTLEGIITPKALDAGAAEGGAVSLYTSVAASHRVSQWEDLDAAKSSIEYCVADKELQEDAQFLTQAIGAGLRTGKLHPEAAIAMYLHARQAELKRPAQQQGPQMIAQAVANGLLHGVITPDERQRPQFDDKIQTQLTLALGRIIATSDSPIVDEMKRKTRTQALPPVLLYGENRLLAEYGRQIGGIGMIGI